ncbi:MAG: hypothetical protein NUV65_06700 [Candidatus Roizmanbacteria bacterium]|nr:hypothetical protein [Candidatus Roizmanbacteria bacterium]
MKIKKIDKSYLHGLRIDIRTEKDILYQDLAIFFDKDKFLQMLPNLRKAYGVTDLFTLGEFKKQLDSYEKGWFIENKTGIIDLSKYSRIKEVKENFPEFYDFITSSQNALPETFDAECNLICYEFKRPPYFIDAIKQAILCGAVDDTLFKPTEAKTVDFSLLGAWPALNQIAIFVSPISTYDDVDEELRKAKEMMKTNEFMSYYKPHADTTPNVRKYREWYWGKIKLGSVKEVDKEWQKAHINENDTTTYLDIIKGIKAYENLLASYLPFIGL